MIEEDISNIRSTDFLNMKLIQFKWSVDGLMFMLIGDMCLLFSFSSWAYCNVNNISNNILLIPIIFLLVGVLSFFAFLYSIKESKEIYNKYRKAYPENIITPFIKEIRREDT